MALIQLGAFFTALSGKIGGQSISNRAQQTTIRNITHTNSTPTIKQSLQRYTTGVLSNAYQFITSIQRAGWSTASTDYTYINRVGNTITRNGYQTYSFCNQNLSLIDKTLLDAAPLYVPVTQPKINIVDISSGNFEINSNNSDAAYLYALFAAPNLSNGTRNAKSKMKYCGSITSAQLAAGYDVISDIESVFGTLIFPNNISIIIDPINQTTGNRNQFVTEIFNEDTPMILEVTVTDGQSITIPFQSGGTYSGSVDYGDGNQNTFASYNDANLTHTYTNGGVYLINIIGSFPKFNAPLFSFSLVLSNILQFGSNHFSLLQFFNCALLTDVTISDTPSFSSNATLARLFRSCANITNVGNLENWDVSNVVNMFESFYTAPFNQDLSLWDVSNVTTFDSCFIGASLNFDFSLWDVSSGSIFRFMLANQYFASDIGGWNMANATNLQGMFSSSVLFNQDLSLWDVSGVTNFNRVLYNTSIFNQDLSSWDITAATNMAQFGNLSNFSDANWDAMLIAWAALTTPPSTITIGINATHTAAANAAYTTLTTTYSWTINENV